MIQKCRICEVELTDDNRYVSGKNKLRKMCKDCFKEDRRRRYKECNKKPSSIYMENIYTGDTLEFSGFFSRNEFLTMRRLQSRFSREAVGSSSRCNQQVEYVKETTDTATGDIHREYSVARCEECGGIIRYDDNDDKVCDNCGLLSTIIIFDKLRYTSDYKRTLDQSSYYKRAHRP